MRVKDANYRIQELRRLSNDIQLLNQYFLNEQDLSIKIANLQGMSSPVANTLVTALDEIQTMTSDFERAVLETEIGNPGSYQSNNTR